jgi:hypothetical protein
VNNLSDESFPELFLQEKETNGKSSHIITDEIWL